MESELEIFFNTSQDLMCIANTEGFFERVNPRFEEVLGYAKDELLSNPFITFVHPDDHKSTIKEVEKLGEGRPTVNFSNQYRKKDGEYVWLEWTAAPYKNKIYAIARDVTEKQKLVTELTTEKEQFIDLTRRYEFATESAGIGVWYWDFGSDSIVWNDQMYALYNLGKEEFDCTSDTWRNLALEEDRKMVGKAIQEAIDTAGQFDTTFRIQWKDGSVHYINAIGTAEKNHVGKVVQMIGINVDVTKDRDLNLARSNFISFASHQFRAPLVAIRWIVNELSREHLSETGQKYLTDVEESAMRLARLVDEILNLSRIEGGHLAVKSEYFDFILFLDEFLSESKLLMDRRNIDIDKHPYVSQLDIESDKYLMRNIIQSIISNAIEYTPDCGKVTIGVEDCGDTFQLTVSDTGVGIPKEDHGHLFTQFARGSNASNIKAEGTGLGLFIAKQSVDLLRGKIWYESEEGKGTIFYVTLPKRFAA